VEAPIQVQSGQQQAFTVSGSQGVWKIEGR
jgi:hypothetical protein